MFFDKIVPLVSNKIKIYAKKQTSPFEISDN